MKIGLVVPGFSAHEHDWCIPALLNFVRRLATENCVHVFALEYPYRRDEYSVYNATVHSIGGRNRGKAYAPRLWSDTLAAIRAEHRRARFDVLHAFWANEPGAITMVAGRALKIPIIVSVAGGELVGLRQIDYGGQMHLIERTMIDWTMHAADRVTVGSRYLFAIAARRRSDARMLPLGVDTQMFSPRERRERSTPLTILNVGSLVPVKNQIELLNAFARLERPDTCLEIIGTGILEHELRARAKMLGIENHVAFVGAIPHDALPFRYRKADLIVQSSLHEAQGMAIFEAAACGVPVAGTSVGILPELAERSGGVSANDLTEAMENALQAREQMGRNGRRAVEENFSMEATWDGWTKLYQQVQRV